VVIRFPEVTAVHKVTYDNVRQLADLVSGRVERRAEMDPDGWCSGSPEIVMSSGIAPDENPRRVHEVIAEIGSYIVEFDGGVYKVFGAAEVIA
jgi:hypothetical protein